MSVALLKVNELSAGYRAHRVLEQVDLTVGAGELWVILGPNGAGKSTLLKACLGLVPARGGEVELFGRPLAAWDRRALAREVAWVPQSAELPAGFKGLDVVLMGRAPHQGGLSLASEADVALAHGIMDELEIAALAGRDASELSGGERRLLLLARALAQAPRLLLLDEPTAFLDLKHQVEVLTRLRARVHAGLGAVAVLHDVNLAAGFADRALLLRDGAVLASGPAGDLLREPELERLYDLSMVSAQVGSGQKVFAPRLPR